MGVHNKVHPSLYHNTVVGGACSGAPHRDHITTEAKRVDKALALVCAWSGLKAGRHAQA